MLVDAVNSENQLQPSLQSLLGISSDFCIGNRKAINARQKVEEGIDVSQGTIAKIQQLMPKILKRQDDPEIKWYESHNLVFSLTSVPNLIFKAAYPDRDVLQGKKSLNSQELMEQRFANMVRAQEVCMAHQLSLLIIPHAKKIDVDGMTIIAEQRFNIQQSESAQEYLYQELSHLDETVRQLAIFILKTGFSDVVWRNMPIINDSPEFQGPRRVVIVDLEEMEGAADGIFGGAYGRRGLIRCLFSEKQIDIVLAEACRHKVVSCSVTPEQAKASRMKEIQTDQQLQQFYAKNGILAHARKPIQVDDLTTLGLNLDEKGYYYKRKLGKGVDIEYIQQPITLREAVVDVIAQINKAIAETSEDASVKGKRYILLNTNRGSLRDYNELGLPEGKGFVTEKERSQIWLRRIVNALIEKGHIFKLDNVNGHGYFIQA